MTKDEIDYLILREINAKLPFKYDPCNKVISYNDNDVCCIGCRGIVCPMCTGNSRIAVCSPCKLLLKERYDIPIKLYKLSYKKKLENEALGDDIDFSQNL